MHGLVLKLPWGSRRGCEEEKKTMGMLVAWAMRQGVGRLENKGERDTTQTFIYSYTT